MYIPVILGTGREGRKSIRAAKFVKRELEKRGITSSIIDVRDYIFGVTTIDKDDPRVKQFAKEINKADALVVVVPEYNHFFPGEFKILMDTLYEEYDKKPVSICSVASGAHGGTRVLDMTKLYLTTLGMVTTKYNLLFPNIDELLDDNGIALNKRLHNYVEKMISELIWLARVLNENN